MLRPSLPALLSLALVACDAGLPGKGGDAVDTSVEDAWDGDGDGFGAEEDCNDSDSSIHSGAPELCDGVDNNCDGEVDEGVQSEWYVDSDGDGFGDPDRVEEACAQAEGRVANGNDCDDADEQVYPGAPESCDGVDNDCDGSPDDGEGETWYTDADGDGYGDPSAPVTACEAGPGISANAEDCDDDRDSAYPGADEVCDEIDNDCDGDIDEDVTLTWYADRDADGWGVSEDATEACARPDGYAADPGDCDDEDEDYHPGAEEDDCTDPADYNCDGSTGYADADADGWAACEECDDTSAGVHPGATEVCNSLDDDCDGDTDDADGGLDRSTATAWYDDDDGDLYGDPLDSSVSCLPPAGSVAEASDCDDRLGSVNPSATETCNDIDDDCDRLIDDEDSSLDLSSASDWYLDLDGDSYGDPAAGSLACEAPADAVSDDSDCDDGDARVSPSATEICNDIDDDCDGQIDDEDSSLDLSSASTWYADADEDGHGDASASSRACEEPEGSVETSDDCDDGDDSVSPSATELCNDIDDDCDSAVDEGLSTSTWHPDDDGDGYGDADSSITDCAQPPDTLADGSDCDDSDATALPGALERLDGADDDCDGLVDEAVVLHIFSHHCTELAGHPLYSPGVATAFEASRVNDYIEGVMLLGLDRADDPSTGWDASVDLLDYELVMFNDCGWSWEESEQGIVNAMLAAQDAGVATIVLGDDIGWGNQLVSGEESLTLMRDASPGNGTSGTFTMAGSSHAAYRGPYGTPSSFSYPNDMDQTYALGVGETVLATHSAYGSPVWSVYEDSAGQRAVMLNTSIYMSNHTHVGSDAEAQLQLVLQNSVAWALDM